MFFQQLKDAAFVLQRPVHFGYAVLVHLESPLALVVFTHGGALGILLVAGKKAVLESVFLPTMKGALVYSDTYSWLYSLFSRMYLIIPPRKAMSVPERRAVYMSALDEVRVKRGSTLISVAPFSMASVTYLKEWGGFQRRCFP
jgi:hypothetical protein